MLKLYIQDLCWQGAILVIAESEEQARAIMEEKRADMYEKDYGVESYDLSVGYLETVGGE